MKGLYRKDFYALKRMLFTFFLVCGVVIIFSVLFVFSAKYGNMALNKEEMGEAAVLIMTKEMTLLPLLLPLAFIGQIGDCFKMDEEAGFYKLQGSMPISAYKIVGARFLTIFTIGGIGITVSVIGALLLSTCSEDMKFYDMVRYPFILLLFMLVFYGVFLPLAYGMKNKVYQTIMIILVLSIMIGGGVLLGLRMPKEEAEILPWLKDGIAHMMQFITDYLWLLFLVASAFLAAAYFASVSIVKRREWT